MNIYEKNPNDVISNEYNCAPQKFISGDMLIEENNEIQYENDKNDVKNKKITKKNDYSVYLFFVFVLIILIIFGFVKYKK